MTLAVIGCAGERPAGSQARAGSRGRPSRISYIPLRQVCQKALCDHDAFEVNECDCRAHYVPARTLSVSDVAAGVEWILRNGHRVDEDIPVLTRSVYVVGSIAPNGHVARVGTLSELQGLAAERGQRLDYLRAAAEGQDVIINHPRHQPIRARLLTVEFGFEPSRGVGAIGTCGFALYRQKGGLAITETGGCVLR